MPPCFYKKGVADATVSESVSATVDSSSKNVGSEKQFKCEQCEKTFSGSSSLIRHIKTHSNEKPFSCDQCSKVFSRLSSLKRHQGSHAAERPFKCTVCGWTFLQNSDLKIHERTHTGEKPFASDRCEQAFGCKKRLRAHYRKHTGEKPYKCPQYEKSFSMRKNVIQHLRIHTSERPLTYEVCKKMYRHQHTLKKHKQPHAVRCTSSLTSVCNRLECLRLLWSLLKSRNNKVVSGAAWAVYRLMQDTPQEAWEIARSFVGGLDLIVGLLKSDDLKVLTSACAVISVIACDRENLGVLTDYDVVSHLAYLTNKKDTLLRHHLAEAIAMCSKWGNNAKRFCDKGAVKSMVEYLGSVDIIVQRSAMRALEQLGKSPESCIIMHRGGVVKLLLEMIGSEDAGLQVAAAGCLLNMRQLAMANEQARQEQWNNNSS
ncbi:uncharacterized protein [Acropora muricata]|uniref:uncharacterized protein isoform X1 n=1 Tax=Acropora muricata TaxID=159855 RepID=UPI0034E45D48